MPDWVRCLYLESTSFRLRGISNEFVFRVADNGIGMQNNISPEDTGFGTELVNLLVQQLGGKQTVNTGKGTNISIHFKYKGHHNGYAN